MAEEKNAEVQIPKYIEILKPEVFEIPQNAIAVGVTMNNLNWPRRKIVNRLQLRLDYYLDAGGIYKDHHGEIFPIHEDSIEQTFGDDPGYKWLSVFPKYCKQNPSANYSPPKRLLPRFQILDAALRTPPLGFAI